MVIVSTMYNNTSYYSGFCKGLFTWREGAPANRAFRLEGLKYSPPLHATHLTGTGPKKARVIKCKPSWSPKERGEGGGGHGPRPSYRRPWKLGMFAFSFVNDVLYRMLRAAKIVLERIMPYTFISNAKMAIVFGTGRSTNFYIA